MKYTYLLINFLTVIFPVLLSFDKRVQFHKSWKYLWPGMLLTGVFFLVWDVLFTVKGVWWFNADYITGITLYKLPLEEILFFLTVPFACVFIYSCLNYYIKRQMGLRLTRTISNMLLILSACLLILYYDRIYTVVTFGLLFVLVTIIQFVIKAKWLNRFYLAYIVALVPFYVVNGILTALPVVLYNDAENVGIRAGTIPVEDHFYLMGLLIMNIAFFEYFKKRRKLSNG